MRLKPRRLNRIELLLLTVSFGILAITIIAKLYQTHLLKERFSEVVQATERFKVAIELCAKFGECAKSGKLAGMQEGTMGIPDTFSTNHLDLIMVAPNGTITAKATMLDGLTGETYVLTPIYSKGAPMTWVTSGTCKTRPGGAIC